MSNLTIRIRNREQLIKNGETPSIRKYRAYALRCLKQAVNAVEPKQLIKAKVKVKSNHLLVEDYNFDLKSLTMFMLWAGAKQVVKWLKP